MHDALKKVESPEDPMTTSSMQRYLVDGVSARSNIKLNSHVRVGSILHKWADTIIFYRMCLRHVFFCNFMVDTDFSIYTFSMSAYRSPR